MRNEAFLRLFAGSGRRELGDGLELRVVPAYEVLQSRREAMDACGEDEQTLGLWMNACLLARAIYRDGGGRKIMRRSAGRKILLAARKTRKRRCGRWSRRNMNGSNGAF